MQDLIIKTGTNIPYLLNDNEEKNIIIRIGVQPSDEIRKDFMEKERVNGGVNLCLVLDVSASMSTVVSNEGVERTGEYGYSEGVKVEYVRNGVSRFEVAKEAVEKLINNCHDEDVISLIIYNDLPKVVFKNIPGTQRDYMISEVSRVDVDGNTNISAAIREARMLMKEATDEKVKKIIFLTDGIPTCDTEEDGLREAEYVADDGISLDCLGIGNKEIKFSFLEKLSIPSNGRTNLIDNAEEAVRIFDNLFDKSRQVIMTNVKLVLSEISPLVRINDHYRGTPEKKYLGKAKISPEREYSINIGQIEKDQLYNFYFNATVSSKVSLRGPFNIMKTSVEYSVPELYGEKVMTNANVVVVEFGADSRKSRYRSSDIERDFNMVEIKRYEDEIEEASAAGNDAKVVNNLQKIINICEYLKNQELIDGYTAILEKYKDDKKLDMSKMNENRNTSTKIGDDGLIDSPLDIDSIFND